MARIRIWVILVVTASVTIYFFLRNTTASTTESLLQLPDSIIQSGDIIFRDGRGVISMIFRNTSLNDQSYSHAGFIHKEGPETYVYHIIGGESDSSVMRKEKISDFCSRREAYAFGIYRSGLNESKIDSLAGHYFSQQLRFDDKFDLLTDNKMYCTELVYKILTTVSKVDNFLPLTTVRNVSYCSCDNIFLSPHIKKIYSYKYK